MYFVILDSSQVQFLGDIELADSSKQSMKNLKSVDEFGSLFFHFIKFCFISVGIIAILSRFILIRYSYSIKPLYYRRDWSLLI